MVAVVALTVLAVAVAMVHKIQSVADFLPSGIVSELDNLIAESGWNYGWKSNTKIGYSHWNIDFAGGIVENGLDVENQLPPQAQQAWQHVEAQYFPNHRLIRCYANAHTYGVEGYPHTDSLRQSDQTVVVYLNKSWRREWGGETLIYHGDTIVHAQLPRRNTALIFPGNCWHASRGVTRICPDLRVSFMFKICDNVDQDRDRIQTFLESCQTDAKPHSKNTLCGHLLRVYDLLKNAKQSQQVCSAGAMHSVFGTNLYHDVTVPLSERWRVRDLVGESATELAELFCNLSRPATLERSIMGANLKLLSRSGSEIAVTHEQLTALSAIEAANLEDQNELARFPNLSKFWHELNN
jgi:2OG-Fe(II) oxygenase superfamily